MRIRNTKPEFFRSKRVSERIPDWGHRYLLKALESYVDDNGVGKDDLALIAADCFSQDIALDPSGTFRRLTEGLSVLFEAGFIHRYEVEGDKCLYISWWESTQYVQKPKAGRLPRPDGTLHYGSSEIGEPNRNFPEASGKFQPVSGNQGIRESGKVAESDDSDDGPSKPDKNDRDDIRSVLDHLDQKLQEYDPETRLPNRTQANLDAARLLLDRDSRTVDQVKAAIDYSQDSEFWRPNIRSMSKLRDKYETLRAQAQSTSQRNGTTQPQPTGSLLWDDEARKKAHERPSYLTDTDHI